MNTLCINILVKELTQLLSQNHIEIYFNLIESKSLAWTYHIKISHGIQNYISRIARPVTITHSCIWPDAVNFFAVAVSPNILDTKTGSWFFHQMRWIKMKHSTVIFSAWIKQFLALIDITGSFNKYLKSNSLQPL